MSRYVETKKRATLYWRCQIIGWGLVSLWWLYIAIFRDKFTITQAVVNYLLDIIICIGLTHGYRFAALKLNWNHLEITKLIIRAIPSVILLSFSFMAIMNIKASGYVYLKYGQNIFSENLLVWNPVLITGLRHMSIWVLAYHAYHFYLREVNLIKTNSELLVVAKQSQLDSLSSQLNPHFLFNSLNSIKALVFENPKTSRRAVDLLSDILRSSLYKNGGATISLSEELSLVKDYLELEELRFEERLKVKIEMDPKLDDCKIPPLSIQLLAENAIKHGISEEFAGGMVEISIGEKDNFLLIQVKNPGVLGDIENNGIGLENLKKRIFLQYNGKADFGIQDLGNGKVVASLRIPQNKKNETL